MTTARLLVGVLILASCTASSTSTPRPTSTTAASAARTGAAVTAAVSSTSGVASTGRPVGWKRIADIPTARSEVAATVDQLDTVYVIGGFGGPKTVERFTPDGKWERLAELPIAVDHAMAAAVSGIQFSGDEGIYAMGGYIDGAATARAFRFDRTTGKWSEIASMPGPRAAAAAVALNGRIFVVGGAEGGRLVAPTYEYDVGTRRWRTLAPIPTPRDHLAAAEMNGQVCAVGGRRLALTANLPTLECYGPQTDKWESLPPAPTARGGVGAAFYDSRLYFIGGEQPSGTFREVEIYNPALRAWSRGPDLPTPRHGIGVVVTCCTSRSSGAHLYVIAGGPTPGGSQIATVEALDLP